MITYKTFVEYNTLNTREEVEQWFNDDRTICSNIENHLEIVNNLNDYKDSHKRHYGKNPDKKKYTNIWGHKLVVLIPFEFHESNKASQFINEYMTQIDSEFKQKKYLYCYKFYSQGNGLYADIICFTRKIYSSPKEKNVVWNSDYYWDSVKKHRTKRNNPNAVLLHKKGDLKLDKNGKPIVLKLHVSDVEKGIFKYTNFNIKKLTSRLRRIVNDVRLALIRSVETLTDTYKKFISLIPRKKDATRYFIARKHLRNNLINDINKQLLYYQNALYQCKLCDDLPFYDKNGYFHYGLNKNLHSFNHLIYRINKIVHEDKIVWKKNGGDVGIYLGGQQSFVSYREELDKLKNYINTLMQHWWDTINPSIFDTYNIIAQANNTANNSLKKVTINKVVKFDELDEFHLLNSRNYKKI